MSIFHDIKERLPLRQVAEHYGLKIGRNGMAKCPFHPDKTPSLKIYDQNYHCFGCGAHGDSIGYVARLYGLSQYDAARRIIEDFSLPIEVGYKDSKQQEKDRIIWRREKDERNQIIRYQERFKSWCNSITEQLFQSEDGINFIKDSFGNATPEEVFGSEDFAEAVHMEPLVGYWLDLLCLGTEKERFELFTQARKEVDRHVRRIEEIVSRRVETGRRDPGRRIQQCG